MSDQANSVREEYQGASVATGSTSWWAAGHIIGLPIGGAIGLILGQNERWHDAVVGAWKSTKGTWDALWSGITKRLSFGEAASHSRVGAYVLSGAVTGSAIFGLVAWFVGAGAEIRNAIRGRTQFDRLQDRIEDLSAENAALHAKAEALFEQLKLAQAPKHEITLVASHEKPAAHRESHVKHDSHVAALAGQGAVEAVRA